MVSRSPSRGREMSRTRSPTPRSDDSRSPSRRRRHESRSPSRSVTSPPRRNGRYRSESRSRSPSRSRSRSRSRSWSRDRSASPAKSTKIVVERLTKNINEGHLHELFGQFGPIADLDLPMNRSFGTNRGTAYILYDHVADAEAAIAHMHEAHVDGAMINVSIVLPRRRLSPAPPTARRGANIDPRVPFAGPRASGGGTSASMAAGSFSGAERRRHASPGRYGPRSDAYRPTSRSPSKSPIGDSGSRRGGSRYRSRSQDSYSSRGRSRSPGPRRHGAGGRSPSYDSRDGRGRSRSPARGNRNYR